MLPSFDIALALIKEGESITTKEIEDPEINPNIKETIDMD